MCVCVCVCACVSHNTAAENQIYERHMVRKAICKFYSHTHNSALFQKQNTKLIVLAQRKMTFHVHSREIMSLVFIFK